MRSYNSKIAEELEIKEEMIEKSETVTPEKQEELPTLTNIELYANRQDKLRARKARIAALASSLIENPEENVSKLTFEDSFHDFVSCSIF